MCPFLDSFPWIVKLVLVNSNDEHLLLCTGAAVSQYVAIFPAHCVSGNEKSRLAVIPTGFLTRNPENNQEKIPVENIITHPDYVFRHVTHVQLTQM